MTDDRIPTNLRMLLILEVLGRSDRAMTPTELNEHVGLPKQTIHRLCATLEAEGFLTRAENPKKLRPGRRLRELAAGLMHGDPQHLARHQILKRVGAQIGETVNFVVAHETGMQYVDRVETDWPLRIQLPVGSAVPFHCTASGKVFLASLKPKSREELVGTLMLEPRTRNTHCSSEALLNELKTIARDGYSTDREEFMEGMVALAVPVRDARGRFIAALAVHGPSQRLHFPQALEKKEILLNGAQELQAALFS